MRSTSLPPKTTCGVQSAPTGRRIAPAGLVKSRHEAGALWASCELRRREPPDGCQLPSEKPFEARIEAARLEKIPIDRWKCDRRQDVCSNDLIERDYSATW